MLRSGRGSQNNFAARGLASLILAGGLESGLPAEEMVINLALLGTVHPGFLIEGTTPKENSGVEVSGVGDVNGDGMADVIVVGNVIAPDSSTIGSRANVVFGRSGGDAGDLGVQESNGFTITGIGSGFRFGISASGAGDVNGDRLTDLLVGIPRGDESYVVFGKEDAAPVDLASLGTGGFRIDGTGVGGGTGSSVSGAGDLNGDGLADLIVGAPRSRPDGQYPQLHGPAGSSFVVFGKEDVGAVELAALNGGGFRMDGANPGDYLGYSVSGAGDVNGDGVADLIVGAMRADPSGKRYAGESYVVFGKGDGGTVKLAAPGTSGFRISGAEASDYSGLSVSGAGDVNGDGLADLIVGSLGSDPEGRSSAGDSYVVFGKPDGATVDLASLGSGGFRIEGAESWDRSGISVSGAGDVDGDGLADLIVGASGANPGGISGAGQFYVVYGKRNVETVKLATLGAGGFLVPGIGSGFETGRSVSGAGDINGDGLADLIAGAPHAKVGGMADTGESYVVFNPLSAPDSATYRATARAGNAPRIAIGISGDGSNDSSPDSRCWIDFFGSEGPGLEGSSMQTVTLVRRDAPVSNLPHAADVLWHVESDRFDPESTITFRFLDDDIAPYREFDLKLYRADDPAGPWEPVTDWFFVDEDLNLIGGDVTELGYFAVQMNPELATADFAASEEGWSFFVPTPPFSNTMSGSYSPTSGALIATTAQASNTFGYWESPLVALSPVHPGVDILYRATFTVASDLADRSLAPTMRLRLSSPDFQRADLLTATSIGSGNLSPGIVERDYQACYHGPADQLRLDFDVLSFDPTNAPNASMELRRVRLELLDQTALQAEGEPLSFDLTESTVGWTTGFDGTGQLDAPAVFEATDEGLLIRGQAIAPRPQSTTYSPPVLFGFWTTSIPEPPGRTALYCAKWVVGSDLPERKRESVPAFRLRINDASQQFGSTVVIDSTVRLAHVPYEGQDQLYEHWFVAPPEIAGNDLILSFDYLYADRSSSGGPAIDEPTAGLWLRRVEISRYR